MRRLVDGANYGVVLWGACAAFGLAERLKACITMTFLAGATVIVGSFVTMLIALIARTSPAEAVHAIANANWLFHRSGRTGSVLEFISALNLCYFAVIGIMLASRHKTTRLRAFAATTCTALFAWAIVAAIG